VTCRIVSWNVNGVRSAHGKGLPEFIRSSNPDVLCLQETKCETAKAQAIDLGFAHTAWHEAEKKGYSGTAILSRVAPIAVRADFPGVHPREGRVLTAEFKELYLVNAYVPNSQRELTRLSYRLGWDEDFRAYLAQLEKNKPVLVCGDFNCAHEPIDLANPQANRQNAGFTDEERESFGKLLGENGFTDTFRAQHPGLEKQYSWWTYRMGARQRNIGWRLDYFLASRGLKGAWDQAKIHPEITGSDHCPVSVRISAAL
jgi:exodeoxyribonuclease-3